VLLVTLLVVASALWWQREQLGDLLTGDGQSTEESAPG
jgi:hypothetical protein